jgi:hypothetical protein
MQQLSAEHCFANPVRPQNRTLVVWSRIDPLVQNLPLRIEIMEMMVPHYIDLLRKKKAPEVDDLPWICHRRDGAHYLLW